MRIRRLAGIGVGLLALIGAAFSTQLRAQENQKKQEPPEQLEKRQSVVPSHKGLPLSSHLDPKVIKLQQEVAAAHCAWLEERIKEMQAVRIGMTRTGVEKMLAVDGGGFTLRADERYMNPKCEYIKLDIHYKLDKGTKESDGQENDIVDKISGPLLDLVSNRSRF